jgi:hypothetical protein
MRMPRPLLSIVVSLFLLASAAPGITAQIEGETWTSPTYGFSVSWAGTDWEPDPEGTLTAVGPERLDRLHLLNGVSSLYFEGATRYEGDLGSCVAEEANLLAQETGVSEIRPYRDEDGVVLVADGPNSSAAAFSLTLAVGEEEIELVDYVECRTLIPGEAVLVITLVTEPAAFQTELDAAQSVIATITQVEKVRDPLAVYGGWLAAARERPSVAGPLSGELAFGPDDLAVERAGVDAPDFYARATFANPEPARETWDIGLGFRDSGGEEQLRLVVDSAGTWFLKDGLGPVIAGGSVADFDTSATGSNVIEVVAAGDSGYFAFNERLVGEIDLSARTEGGDIFVGAGFFNEDATEPGTTDFSELQIWSLSGLDPQAVLEPAITIDEPAFATLTTAATAETPLAGPASGELVQAVGSATVMPAGVDVADFVALVTFANPSDAADQPWDFGIAFREQANGDHYRLTIASDGTWEYQIGLQTDLAGGAVPSLSFEEGASNSLEIVVAGDAAAFAVNGVFVSELDASELDSASEVWVGAGFHQANVGDGAETEFQDFTVWPLETAAVATVVPLATPVGTPVAMGEEVALRLDEQAESGIDGLAVLTGQDGETTVTITTRGATGDEVLVIHRGPCGAPSLLPAFLLEDLDATGRSETTIVAPLADLTDSEHTIALHRNAENYAEVVACGVVPAQG